MSLNPVSSNDIVLLRHKINVSFPVGFWSVNEVKINESIKIEPNVKYEIRIKFSNYNSKKYYTNFLFTSNECKTENHGIVSIKGSSPVISSLLFKLRA